jgi:hypothetical protein
MITKAEYFDTFHSETAVIPVHCYTCVQTVHVVRYLVNQANFKG